MITEDRKSDGLLMSRPVRENVSLIDLSRFVGRLGRIRTGAEGTAVRTRAAGLELRCRSIEQPVGELSGGNQQKVAIAKWLDHSADFCRSRSDMADASPRIFLFDEPTRGIDVAARQKIYELFESLAASGAGLLIVSSDLDELMQTCDAIGVISMGRWVTRFERDAWDRESIMKACFHHHRRDTAAG
jgi:ribose transport system ATP-binding protein